MRYALASFASAVTAAALLLGISAHEAKAVSVFVTSVSGTWSNVTGSPVGLTGVGTNQISFGQDIGSGQSGYLFQGVAPPTQGPYATGTSFNLGTFTHFNEPIGGGTSITGATLNLTIQFHTDAVGDPTHTILSNFQFTHDETPNVGPPGCCDDIVTAVTNVGGSQTFNIGGINYIFAFTGFNLGSDSSFQSPEGGHNSTQIFGSFTDVRNVPGPAVGAGIPGLVAACGGMMGLARRRRKARVSA